ncbi:hypothetical protein P8452_37519 [Trifolium repens]|nr:hypothetical protein P8452_37519 [Trifolium repens]
MHSHGFLSVCHNGKTKKTLGTASPRLHFRVSTFFDLLRTTVYSSPNRTSQHTPAAFPKIVLTSRSSTNTASGLDLHPAYSANMWNEALKPNQQQQEKEVEVSNDNDFYNDFGDLIIHKIQQQEKFYNYSGDLIIHKFGKNKGNDSTL